MYLAENYEIVLVHYRFLRATNYKIKIYCDFYEDTPAYSSAEEVGRKLRSRAKNQLKL